MSKGFTLIELLAVIVILAIILLIAVPMISNVIDSAKKGALDSNAKMLMNAAKLNYSKTTMNGNSGAVSYRFENQVQTSNVEGRLLEFNGDIPKDGFIVVNANGEVTVSIYDGKYCAYSGTTKLIVEELDKADCLSKLAVVTPVLPNNADIAYTNNSSEPNYPTSATPCMINNLDFTHITDKRNDKIYAVTKVGDQCWFAENLAYTRPECLNATWDSTEPHNACKLNGGTGWDKNEVLYQWGAVMIGTKPAPGSQGLCPIGWHVATDNEWKALEMHLGMTQIIADTTGWRDTNEGVRLKDSIKWNGTNDFGITLLPVGYRGTDGNLYDVGAYQAQWTSTIVGLGSWTRHTSTSLLTINRHEDNRAYGFAARCVLD